LQEGTIFEALPRKHAEPEENPPFGFVPHLEFRTVKDIQKPLLLLPAERLPAYDIPLLLPVGTHQGGAGKRVLTGNMLGKRREHFLEAAHLAVVSVHRNGLPPQVIGVLARELRRNVIQQDAGSDMVDEIPPCGSVGFLLGNGCGSGAVVMNAIGCPRIAQTESAPLQPETGMGDMGGDNLDRGGVDYRHHLFGLGGGFLLAARVQADGFALSVDLIAEVVCATSLLLVDRSAFQLHSLSGHRALASCVRGRSKRSRRPRRDPFPRYGSYLAGKDA
jgi:hypothetical protein